MAAALPPLQIVTSLDEVRSSFDLWWSTLESAADTTENEFVLTEYDVSFRYLRTNTHAEFWIGSSEAAAVQINFPRKLDTENGLTAVATDLAGRRYLMRQGSLQANNSSPRIDAATFARRTGVAPIPVHLAGRPAKRPWYTVSALTGIAPNEIVRNTVDFVRLCWTARGFPSPAESKRESDKLKQLFGNDEQGGQRTIQVTIGEKTVFLKQGEVWQSLDKSLALVGLEIAKPRSEHGYEVDGEVVSSNENFLIEIKTDCTAASLYTATGQLLLYPKLIKRVADHTRVLLIPGQPKSALAAAISELGIEIHSYEMSLNGTQLDIKLPNSLLARLAG